MQLVLIASYPGSLIAFRGELIKDFLKQGYTVSVLAPGLHEEDGVTDVLRDWGVSYYGISLKRTGMNPIQDIGSCLQIARILIKIKPDCVLSYTVKPVIYGTLAAQLAKVPYKFALITGLGYAFTGEASGLRRVLKSIIRKLYRNALAKSSKVFFQNQDDKALFQELGLVGQSTPVAVVNGSGIDTIQFKVAPFPGALSFLLIARLLGDKGVREYAQAAAIIKQDYPDIEFKLVGWIDDNPDAIAKSELDQWIKSNAITYLGKLNDVRPAIEASTVYVLPSYREGTPRTVLEAMAMGRPIITTDAPGCKDTVVDGVNGYLIAIKSADQLVEAITKLIENPSLIETMGAESRRIAESKYDVRSVNAFMIKEMENCLCKK